MMFSASEFICPFTTLIPNRNLFVLPQGASINSSMNKCRIISYTWWCCMCRVIVGVNNHSAGMVVEHPLYIWAEMGLNLYHILKMMLKFSMALPIFETLHINYEQKLGFGSHFRHYFIVAAPILVAFLTFLGSILLTRYIYNYVY